jgi:hypothetical protein
VPVTAIGFVERSVRPDKLVAHLELNLRANQFSKSDAECGAPKPGPSW